MSPLEAREWLRGQLWSIVAFSGTDHPTAEQMRQAEEAFERIAARLSTR